MHPTWRRAIVGTTGFVLAAAVVIPLTLAVIEARRDDPPIPPPPEVPCPPPTVSAAPTRPPAGTLGDRAGFSPGSGIINSDDDDLRREMEGIAAAGASWIRLDLDWSHIERRRGEPDWCKADRMLVAARQAGLRVLGLPTYTPSWARPPDTTDKHPPTDVADYAAFVEAAVTRYRPIGVQAYELWNEPNISHFWQPTVDPAAYTELLVAGSAAARKAADDVVVVAGGTAPASDDPAGRSLSPVSFLEGIYEAGGGPAFDEAATHPYSYPEKPMDKGTTFRRLDEVRAVMVANGDDAKRLWLTEVGAPTGEARRAVTADSQAAAVATVFEQGAALRWVGPIFWYSYRDSGRDLHETEANFGLVRRDFEPKPGLAAYRHTARKPDPNPSSGRL